jgi:hypothetical protein
VPQRGAGKNIVTNDTEAFKKEPFIEIGSISADGKVQLKSGLSPAMVCVTIDERPSFIKILHQPIEQTIQPGSEYCGPAIMGLTALRYPNDKTSSDSAVKFISNYTEDQRKTGVSAANGQ